MMRKKLEDGPTLDEAEAAFKKAMAECAEGKGSRQALYDARLEYAVTATVYLVDEMIELETFKAIIAEIEEVDSL